MDDFPPAEESLKKVQVLEEGHADLEQELSSLFREMQITRSILPQYSRFSSKRRARSGRRLPPTLHFSDGQYLNILQSIGRAVYIFDLNCRIIYWNRGAGNLFGYSVAEALGQNVLELLAAPQAYVAGQSIVQLLTRGESWTGQFPVKNKVGKIFQAITSNNPFYDDDGTFIGVLCVSTDIQPFQEERVPLFGVYELPEPDSSFGHCTTVETQLGFAPDEQPLRNATASRFTNLAFKVSNRVKSRFDTGTDNWDYKAGRGDQSDLSEDGSTSGASSPRGHTPRSPFSVFTKIKEKFNKNSR